jgi:transcriptional regulator with XRE-family HTH domain
MTIKALANRLRVLRAERSFTQFETADLAEMSRYRYWRIEHGDLQPTDAERAALARVFGVTEGDVFPLMPVAP